MYIFWLIIIFFSLIFIRLLYTRYAPTLSVPCVEAHADDIILDIRDYQEATNDEIEGAIVIPVAYLKRNYKEIPSGFLHVIASSRLEKNLAIRYLKSKGYPIRGYCLTTSNCRNKIEHCI